MTSRLESGLQLLASLPKAIWMTYFPYMKSQAFMMSMLFGESSVTEDILLDNVKKYIAKAEEQVICEDVRRRGKHE